MYEYIAEHGIIQWNPTHTAHAITAMKEHIDGYEYEEGVVVNVDNETRKAIKQTYKTLVKNDPDITPPENNGD